MAFRERVFVPLEQTRDYLPNSRAGIIESVQRGWKDGLAIPLNGIVGLGHQQGTG